VVKSGSNILDVYRSINDPCTLLTLLETIVAPGQAQYASLPRSVEGSGNARQQEGNRPIHLVARTSTPRLVSHSGSSAACARSTGM